MTQEEKAKAYDEALEKARQLCDYPTSKPFISDLQDLFPELAESDDEKMIGNIRRIIEQYALSKSAVDVNGELCEREYIDADNWLKSIKERVQTKQEWSEEDENRLSDAVFFVREYQIPTRDKRLLNAAKEAEEWLKSLKERYTWKPSDEYIGMQNEIAQLRAKLRDYGCEL